MHPTAPGSTSTVFFYFEVSSIASHSQLTTLRTVLVPTKTTTVKVHVVLLVLLFPSMIDVAFSYRPHQLSPPSLLVLSPHGLVGDDDAHYRPTRRQLLQHQHGMRRQLENSPIIYSSVVYSRSQYESQEQQQEIIEQPEKSPSSIIHTTTTHHQS
jgi:hypothetical protein